MKFSAYTNYTHTKLEFGYFQLGKLWQNMQLSLIIEHHKD